MRFALGFALAGLVLATGLIAYHGAGIVFAALGSAGLGLVWASLFHAVPMAVNAEGWRVLLGKRRRPSLAYFTILTWFREAINGLLPVARIGGEVVAVRLLIRRGIKSRPAIASIVVDMTLSLATQFIYTLLGLVLLIQHTAALALTQSIALGLLVLAPIFIGFYLVQRYGLFETIARIVQRLFGERFTAFTGGAAALDRSIHALYARPWRLLACAMWQLAGWVLVAGEIWLALFYLGHKVSVTEAILIDAMVHAVSSAAFFVPAALGIQEGAFLLIGGLLGLSPEACLALALARRARDLIVFLPALLVWQFGEGRVFFAGTRTGMKTPAQ